MNCTSLKYQGKVNLKFKIKDKIYNIQQFNAGLPQLQYAFSKLMIGDPINDTMYPHYLDLRISSDSGTTYTSYLQSPIPLSGKNLNWEIINGVKTYSATLTAVLAATSFSNEVRPTASELFRLYLYTKSSSETLDFAYIDISPQVLSRVTPGVQAVVEWTLQLLLDETSETNSENNN